MPGTTFTIRALSVLAIAIATGCGAASTSPASGAQHPTVVVQPPTATLPPHGRRSFAAAVYGMASTAVQWSVREAGGGTVDPEGVYTAPGTTGTYHVVAAAVADLDVKGEAVVTVANMTVSIQISPKITSVVTNGTVRFTATVNGAADESVTWSVDPAGAGTCTNGTYQAPPTAGTYHVIARSHADPTKTDTADVTVYDPGQASAKWVTAYWQAYQQNWSQAVNIDWSSLTHLAIGVAFTTATGGLTYGYGMSESAGTNFDRPMPGDSTDQRRVQAITSAAHARGRKAILQIGGDGDQNVGSATSAAYRAGFVRTILATCDALKLDGVDIDWEYNINGPLLTALISDLRAAANAYTSASHPSGWTDFLIVVAAGNQQGWAAPCAQVAGLIDQFNIMSYDMQYTWWQSPLYSPGDDGHTGLSVSRVVNDAVAAGIPPAKIGIGIHYAGAAAGSKVEYRALAPRYLTDAYHFDTRAYGGKLTGASNTVYFEDEASIKAKADYVYAGGYGGVITFTKVMADFDIVPSMGLFRNPLADAVKRHFLKRPPSPAPRASTVVTFGAANNGTGAVSVSGVGTAAVWFVIRKDGANGVIDSIFDKTIAGPTHGVPTSYVIQAYVGTSWRTLVTVTGNNLGSRMHVVDLTGATQVRMMLTAAPDAQYPGYVDFAVHDLRFATDDTLLVLGDSNCAMQQQGAGAGEAGRLGYEVHQRDATRWPIALQGGTSQATTADFLSTTTYGIPRIRYWLQQLPVKYVALQIGSNDVNAMSQPATTAQLDAMQSRMESIIKEVLAQGRTVILPRLRWMNGNAAAFPGGVHGSETANLEAWHARLDALATKYPGVMRGPDVYTPSKDRTDLINADGVHPTAAGVAQSMQVWADWAIANLYSP